MKDSIALKDKCREVTRAPVLLNDSIALKDRCREVTGVPVSCTLSVKLRTFTPLRCGLPQTLIILKSRIPHLPFPSAYVRISGGVPVAFRLLPLSSAYTVHVKNFTEAAGIPPEARATFQF